MYEEKYIQFIKDMPPAERMQHCDSSIRIHLAELQDLPFDQCKDMMRLYVCDVLDQIKQLFDILTDDAKDCFTSLNHATK